MKIAVLAEAVEGESRVAATPETAKKLIALGAEVFIENAAGLGASFREAEYEAAGAKVGHRDVVLSAANMVLAVQAPDPFTLAGMAPNPQIIAAMNPFGDRPRIDAYAAAGFEALAMEWMPRITRAQSMDVLSSQANLSGYKAVLDAASEYGRAFPMMMTAAGTISAARVFVMGVGVAGLQAIATARRLGAQVSATDVRSVTREQIESLGAKAIFVEDDIGILGEGTGGYAAEMSDAYAAKQAQLVSAHIAKQDIVITTALIPGRPAPRLITDAHLAAMKPGSVLVDLAVEQGGNIEGAVLGAVTERHGVKIIAHRNVPSRLAADASALYSRNLLNFITAFWDENTRQLVLPDDDEIVRSIRLTRGGSVISERLTQ